MEYGNPPLRLRVRRRQLAAGRLGAQFPAPPKGTLRPARAATRRYGSAFVADSSPLAG
ncbi:hypothetical protein [Streptomyces sp. CA2R106]|uniref:hypothetical protein n=1 Tax=Streptomyces sp. CA2R106 TaxID=3120153 RepID=UPI00300A9163